MIIDVCASRMLSTAEYFGPAQIMAHMLTSSVSKGTRGLNCGLSIPPHLVYVSRKALANLRYCTGSPESSLRDNAISTKISCHVKNSLSFWR